MTTLSRCTVRQPKPDCVDKDPLQVRVVKIIILAFQKLYINQASEPREGSPPPTQPGSGHPPGLGTPQNQAL